jgi:ABC-type glycerol-3-phosphate transport system permease component
MVGGVLLLVPLYQMSVKTGLAKTVWGSILSLLLVYIIQTLPVSLYMLGNYFRTIPYSLEEAAADLGVELWEHVGVVLGAMQGIAAELDLEGEPA